MEPASFKNGDVADEPTVVLRIREKLAHRRAGRRRPRRRRQRRRRSCRRAKACHQAGFARILWDAQPALGDHEPTESWVALRPNKFNGDARCCWRLDLD